jgi:hypothetical protein
MSGLRIHHPTLRGCKLIVEHPRKPYHIRIDDDGFCIVSETIWVRLQEAAVANGQPQFTLVNEVLEPPVQTLFDPNARVYRTFKQVGSEVVDLGALQT